MRRVAGKNTRAVMFLMFAILFAACSNAPQVAGGPADFEGGGRYAVFVTNHGWHTGVIVPAGPMLHRLPDLRERFPTARHLELGWGDKDFYQAPQMSVSLALRAILWPTDTVTRVVGITRPVEEYAKTAGLVGLCVDDQSLKALTDFLAQSFAIGADGELQLSQAESGRNSQFYEGSGQYHLLNTCNTWTAKALDSMGMDISPAFKLTAGSVMDYLFQHPDAVTLAIYEESKASDIPAFRCGP